MAISEANFIDENKIKEYLKNGEKNSNNKKIIDDIIKKSKEGLGLSLDDVAALLYVKDEEILSRIFETAEYIKQKIYGNRLVIFAPLYISDYCVNGCTYCGFCINNETKRKKLNQEEIKKEVEILENMGHKRLALELGEHPEETPIEYVLESLKTIYSVNKDNGAIRRVNVNIAATSIEEYKMLKEAGIGTYILFQETYHKETYEKVHPTGPKHNYNYHTTAMHRAMEAGIDDVGMGVLFGLYDHKYELLAMLMHANNLEETYGVGPHTISVPRIKAAKGMSLNDYPYIVPDIEFKKLVAIIRLALPYTGLILSTREDAAFRSKVVKVGVSQISAGSVTEVGGYYDNASGVKPDANAQFEGSDQRSPNEILKEVCMEGYIPSYCTACYRQGRTGERFMNLSKTGEIQNVCLPNALMTFMEYLNDYADDELREIGKKAIENNLKDIKNKKILKSTEEELKKINSGIRDLYL